MEGDEARQRLDRLIRAQRRSYAEVSRAIGRNPAYIQQFIRKGVPRRLPEVERRTIAALLGVTEQELGGPEAMGLPGAVETVPVMPNEGRIPTRTLPLDRGFAMDISAGRPGDLAFFQVEGDAMAPTLRPGDQVLACALEGGPVHDGLHLLQGHERCFVRRLSPNPVTGRISILCDNPGYPPIAELAPEDFRVLGRVVWLGRRVD